MKKAEQEESIIKEYAVNVGESPSTGVYRVVRAFYLKTKNGPNVIVEKNQLCELGRETSETMFFSGKIEPVNIPEKFEVVRLFRTVINGLFFDLRVGDEISEFSKEEALKLMRLGVIKPISEEV